jgi:hypothetical protein
VNDRIRLDPTLYEPVDERRPDRSPEELAGRCVTIETVYGYPDYEARIQDVRMLLKICDGMSQGEILFHLQAIEDEARSDWPSFLRMARQVSLEDELSEDLYGGEDGITD